MCLDSVLVYFRSILNFLSQTEDKIVRVLYYISLPSFMLQVFFYLIRQIPADLAIGVWCGPTLSRSAQCQTATADHADTTNDLNLRWIGIELTIQSYFRAFLAEIGYGLAIMMNIKNGTKLCGCDYENIYGGRVQLENEQPRNLIKPVRRWTLSIIGL